MRLVKSDNYSLCLMTEDAYAKLTDDMAIGDHGCHFQHRIQRRKALLVMNDLPFYDIDFNGVIKRIQEPDLIEYKIRSDYKSR